MSEAIYTRAMIREKTIWPSFLYGMPGFESTKAIVFGLYANTYLLGHNYLEDIETEELQRLIDVYDSNMAELDVDEQNLVLEIASQRYLKTIEIQIKNNVLTTKTQQLNADEQEYDAKLAALDVDQEALETKRTQIELARDRAELKNKDLEARIKLEELAQDYVAVEISQKQLEAARAELSVLITVLKGLEIQIDIANTSYRIVELESSKSGIKVDIEMIKVRTEENKFSSSSEAGSISDRKLFAAKEEKNQMDYEVNSSDLETRKDELITEHKNTIEKEKTHYGNKLIPKEDEINTKQTEKQKALHTAAEQTFTDQETISDDFKAQQEEFSDHRETLADSKRTSRTTISTKNNELYPRRASAAATRKSAAITAAKTMATANITSTLTHEIGSA